MGAWDLPAHGDDPSAPGMGSRDLEESRWKAGGVQAAVSAGVRDEETNWASPGGCTPSGAGDIEQDRGGLEAGSYRCTQIEGNVTAQG